MSQPVEVMRTYSIENARLACGILMRHGIDAAYEDPDFGANFMLAWNLPVTEYIVEIDHQHLERAHEILASEMPEDDDVTAMPDGDESGGDTAGTNADAPDDPP